MQKSRQETTPPTIDPKPSSHQNASSDHTAMTTPLHDESDKSHAVSATPSTFSPAAPDARETIAGKDTAAVMVTPPAKAARDASRPSPAAATDDKRQTTKNNTKSSKSSSITHKVYPKVEVALGDFVAEGGFCSIWELPTIKDLATGDWILAPPPQTTSQKKKSSRNNNHHRKGSSAFGSLGTLAFGAAGFASSSSPRNHKRGASSAAGGSLALLPPAMKSVELTVVRDFEVDDNDAPPPKNAAGATISTSEKDHASRTNDSAELKQNHMRRSLSLVGRNKDKNNHDNDDDDNNNTPVQGPHYVLKCLKPKSFQKAEVLELALKDMQIEIEMLQRIHHPHIISLKAYGTMEMEDYSSYQEKRIAAANAASGINTNNSSSIQSYPFVILNRLGETLNDKCQQWEAKHRKLSSMVGKMITHRKHSKATFCLPERMNVLCDLASALEYLHRHR